MIALIFFLGAIFGSFYLVIGTRLPLKENVITGRSRCDNCKHNLEWYELIPILSYVLQLGKCNYCHHKISKDHLIMEIITGLLFVGGYLYYGLNLNYLTYLVIISVTLVIFISDFKYMIILDSPLVIGSILILIIRYFELGISNTLFSLLYGLTMLIIMYLIKLLGNFLFKRESLGDGDIKLSFFIGLVLGYPGIGIRLSLISLFFSAFLALPYAYASIHLTHKNEVPYGPFLAASMVIVYVFIEKFKRLLIFFLI